MNDLKFQISAGSLIKRGREVATIKDIAQSLGVNAATVSRALNGRKGVSEKLRGEILAKAQELGYRRDPLAAGLITRRTGIIGIVVPDITNPYYACVAQGAGEVLRQRGYGTLLCDSMRSRDQERQCFGMLCAYHVEGAIVLSVTAQSEDLEIFEQHGIRAVCVDNAVSRRSSAVVNDNYQGACDLTEHLIKDCKVQTLVAVMGTPGAETTKERLRGCVDTLKRFDSEARLLKVFYVEPDFEGGLGIAPEAVKLRPECVFAVNDNVAQGIMNYCQNHGVNVPSDLKIAGFDDIAAASMISVPLTTVHQRKFVLGQKAAQQLLYELENPDSPPVRLELLPALMVRGSCGEEPG